MAKLYYRYGPMGSGKSAQLLIVAHNYRDIGRRPFIIKPATDTRSTAVDSRVEFLSKEADLVAGSDLDLFAAVASAHGKGGPIACVLVDEAQFITPQQVNDLFLVAVRLDIPVIGYGLRTDYQAELFPGSARWLALAQLEELKMVCRCNRKATLTGRRGPDGQFIKSDPSESDQVVIGGSESYEALCPTHYLEWVGDGRFVRS
ncbi:MAG: thymidine kinase [Propionibacteriaceae bacterium]|jgi:thymidine kinase|nr:thymidine kinase [Propionibacteriaceae bacterium]